MLQPDRPDHLLPLRRFRLDEGGECFRRVWRRIGAEAGCDAEHILASGQAELVASGRPLLADAAWPLKVAQGRASEIRQCVFRNICWDTINTQLKPIACINNPRVAEPDETDRRPAPAARKRRVIVIGTGVAGLEAAWVAAARGHEVTAFGCGAQVGGKLRLHAQLPIELFIFHDTLARIPEYQFDAARKAGVRFELGHTASAQEIVALDAHAVILATVARMPPRRTCPAKQCPSPTCAHRPVVCSQPRPKATLPVTRYEQG